MLIYLVCFSIAEETCEDRKRSMSAQKASMSTSPSARIQRPKCQEWETSSAEGEEKNAVGVQKLDTALLGGFGSRMARR